MKILTRSTTLLFLVLTACSGGTQVLGDSAKGGSKRVFATSSKYNGNLGGLGGADRECQLAADGADLEGTWKAFIADHETSGLHRIEDVGPWYLVDGETKIFNNKANLATSPLAAIRLDEHGDDVSNDGAWLGAEHRGSQVKNQNDCGGWKEADGVGVGTTANLRDMSPSLQLCNKKAHLICLEQ